MYWNQEFLANISNATDFNSLDYSILNIVDVTADRNSGSHISKFLHLNGHYILIKLLLFFFHSLPLETIEYTSHIQTLLHCITLFINITRSYAPSRDTMRLTG